MADLNGIISIITHIIKCKLNIRLFKKKQDSNMCCLQEMHFKQNNADRLKGKGLEKMHHANSIRKLAWLY